MRMASFTCTLSTLVFISFVLQEGSGLPLSDQAEQAGHIRTKRCSCSSWDDKECIYFCHLDIIWVNTPSKILPFGLGSRPSRRRRRRSAERCRCLDRADGACSSFCRQSSEGPERALRPAGTVSRTLLATVRTVIRSMVAVANRKRLLSRTFR